MTPGTIRVWSLVHRWASLVSTLFLLLLCLTGLPLIFHDEIEGEIEAWTHGETAASPTDGVAPAPNASVERVVEAAKAARPGQVVQYVYWDRDQPDRVGVILNDTPSADPNGSTTLSLDARTSSLVGPVGDGVMLVILRLHTDLFAGLAGKLFLGAMGCLMLVAIISGVVLYAPFMRRLDFGTVRATRGGRLGWLDRHNLLGVVTLAWTLVVGGTGVINTWADLLLDRWRATELASMTAHASTRGAPASLASVDAVMAAAQGAAPGMSPRFVAYPGTVFSSPHDFAVFMRGDAPLTSRLLKPVLIDAGTARLTATRDLPWYLTALFVSQPLHFGDYAGLPLKIIWALLDLITLVVLASGLYLWWGGRRGRPSRRARRPRGGSAPA